MVIHFRWEVRLFDEYVESITPLVKIKKIDNQIGHIMDIMCKSYKVQKQILYGDSKALKLYLLTNEKSYNHMMF